MNVAAQEHAVDEDHPILHVAVMGHVAVGHQHVLMADARGVVLFFGAATDGDAFAKKPPKNCFPSLAVCAPIKRRVLQKAAA